MKERDLGSIGRSPAGRVAGRPAVAAVATPDDRQLEAKAARNQRQRSGVAERIRRIENRRLLRAEPAKGAATQEQVSDECLAARDELVGEDVPWAGFDPAGLKRCASSPARSGRTST
jgi:hypothetical protein